MPKVATCLRMVHDPFPKDEMCVSEPVCETFFDISCRPDAESYTNMITSFKPSDVKLLASICFWTLRGGHDVVSVLKSVMNKYPELITHDLPSWLACHSLGRNYNYYRPTLEGEGSLSIFDFLCKGKCACEGSVYCQEKRTLQDRFVCCVLQVP